MIVERWDLQALECNCCTEMVELRRETIGAPEKLFLLKEQMAQEHRGCEKFAHDPARAKLEREYTKRMARELERAKRRAA